jgi:hypothetical protein
MGWKKLTVCLILAFFCWAPVALADTPATTRLVFHEETGDDVTQYEIHITPQADGYEIHSRFDDRDVLIHCDASLAHQRLEIDRHALDQPIIYVREGEVIKASLGEQTLTKEIDDNPWYQMLEMSKEFVASDKDPGKFWIVSDQMGEVTKESGFSAIKMNAKNKGTEMITHQGQEVEATKIVVRVAGPKGAFWKAEYWYRPSDGVMLRYESVRGRPGTPKTIITLVEEEQIAAR